MYKNANKTKMIASRKFFLGTSLALVALFLSVGLRDTLSDTEQLTILGGSNLPVRELSGLAKTKDDEVAAVGDFDAQIVIANGQADGSLLTKRSVLFASEILNQFSPCPNTDSPHCRSLSKTLSSNWEAMAIDGLGRYFLLQEHTATIYVLSAEGGLNQIINLEFPQGASKGGKKGNDANSGEGLILMQAGHFLVAKEDKPTVLIEFGPAGDEALGLGAVLASDKEFKTPQGLRNRYVALKTWQIPQWKKCDISDMATGPNQTLYLLSQKCGLIGEVEIKSTLSSEVSFSATWRLPKIIVNPEALLVDSEGIFTVGSDIHQDRVNNVFRLK